MTLQLYIDSRDRYQMRQKQIFYVYLLFNTDQPKPTLPLVKYFGNQLSL